MTFPSSGEEWFQRNLNALRRTHPDLAETVAHREPAPHYHWIETDTASPTLEVLRSPRPVLLHSRHDPRLEAERELQSVSPDAPSVFVFIGMGLGYTLEALWENHPGSIAALLLVERDLDVFLHFLRRRDWSALLSNPRVRIVLAERPEDIIPTAQSLLPHIMGSGVRFIDHRPSSQLYPDFYTSAVERLRRFLEQAVAESEFLVHHGKRIQHNVILNLPAMCASHGLGPLRDFYRDQPAVLIAAGPSLRKNLHELARFRKRVLIFCVDTAYRVALELGIVPDFVAAADPTELNGLHFAGIEPNPKVVLLFESDVYPPIPQQWQGPTIFINSDKAAVNRWIEEAAGPFGLFDQGLSVAHTLYTAAAWMGCDPLILIGHDFAYPPEGGSTHAEGTALNRKLAKITEGESHASIQPAAFHPQPTQEEITWVLGVRGKMVPTSKTMVVFLHKLSETIRQSDRKVFDATEGGALIEGTIPCRLNASLSSLELDSNPPDILSFLEENRDPQELGWLSAFDELTAGLASAETEAKAGLSLASHLLQHSNGSEIRNSSEWQNLDQLFWNVYRSRAVQIVLGQALFSNLFLFIRQEKNEPVATRIKKYSQVFESVVQLVREFTGYLEQSRAVIADRCREK